MPTEFEQDHGGEMPPLKRYYNDLYYEITELNCSRLFDISIAVGKLFQAYTGDDPKDESILRLVNETYAESHDHQDFKEQMALLPLTHLSSYVDMTKKPNEATDWYTEVIEKLRSACNDRHGVGCFGEGAEKKCPALGATGAGVPCPMHRAVKVLTYELEEPHFDDIFMYGMDGVTSGMQGLDRTMAKGNLAVKYKYVSQSSYNELAQNYCDKFAEYFNMPYRRFA